LLGDLGQLTPVKAVALEKMASWDTRTLLELESDLAVMGRRIRVELFTDVVLLEGTQRQDDAAFIDMLCAVRNGEVTEAHMEMLRACEVKNCCGEEYGGSGDRTMHMAGTWEVVVEACDNYFATKSQSYATVHAHDTIALPKSEEARSAMFGGWFNREDVQLMKQYVCSPKVEAVKKYPPALRVLINLFM
jgi:hypothetical protein